MTGIPYTIILLCVAGYFLGSIPFGLLLAKMFGAADVRRQGSGNIGAANVARVAGLLAGILTLVLDAAKGAAAVSLAAHFTNSNAMAMMLTGIAALLGHCFTIWLGFNGGKGVATALGLFAALSPIAALSALILFLLVVAYWRYVSLGSIAAAAAMPLLVYFLWAPGHAPPLVIVFGTLFVSALVIFKHDGNLQRLTEGTEPKFRTSRMKGESE